MTLTAKALAVTKSGTPILGPLDCMLEQGQITAICGPNGAGKSTFLAALAGLEEPTAGHVELSGDRLAAMHPRTRAMQVGYLPQDGEIAWDVSVRNLVSLGRLPHRDSAAEPVDSAIEALDLANFVHRPVSRLSGGERARVLLARVLAGEPNWILADEPLAALDLSHQLAIIEVLRKSARAGAGVVMVLHDLAIAMNHADRVIVLDKGVVASDGSPSHALAEPVIRQVWNVDAHWVGPDGARALSV